jgi:maltose alpha-D-glucosyltransferase/alpha-amylase
MAAVMTAAHQAAVAARTGTAARTTRSWASSVSDIRRASRSPRSPFSYKHVNVTDERLAPHSLLTWFERILHARRECEEIGTGDHEVLDVGPDHVLVHRATERADSTLFVHHLADQPSRLKLRAEHDLEQPPLNFVADSDYGNNVDLDDVHVAGYGYRWVRLRRTMGD